MKGDGRAAHVYGTKGGIRSNKTRRHEVSMISAAQSSGDTRQK